MNHNGHVCLGRDKDIRGERAVRTCLACGREFMSAHRGNRRCETCAGRLASVFDWSGARHVVREIGAGL